MEPRLPKMISKGVSPEYTKAMETNNIALHNIGKELFAEMDKTNPIDITEKSEMELKEK